MSNVAGTPPAASEARRFRWRIVPAFVLFVVGGVAGLGGASAFAIVLYHAIRNSWSGATTIDPAANDGVPVLLLSYIPMIVSGLLVIAAAYWCALGRWRATVIAVLLGVAAYACFLLVFRPVPL